MNFTNDPLFRSHYFIGETLQELYISACVYFLHIFATTNYVFFLSLPQEIRFLKQNPSSVDRVSLNSDSKQITCVHGNTVYEMQMCACVFTNHLQESDHKTCFPIGWL